MIFGFTGTRKGMNKIQLENLDGFYKNIFYQNTIYRYTIKEFHHGDCIGADDQAAEIFIKVPHIIHPPSNPKYRAFREGHFILPERSYLERNCDIVDAADMLLAASGTNDEQVRSGTWSTIRYAKKVGKSIVIFYPDGTIENVHY
jgi:hypothetical protein